MRLRVPAVLLLPLFAAGAQQIPAPIEQLVQIPVRTGPGASQPLADSPAITTILTREDLRLGGWRSVGEALQGVAGFYGVDDHHGFNFGVRGTTGGTRSYNRILKVMIDGQPVAYRWDATTLLGPELLPMEAIERIEVSRGPASALYGADAFLGAVNIITRPYDRGTHTALLGWGGQMGGRPASGGEVLHAQGRERWGMLFTASGSRTDLSGLELPATAPVLLTTPGAPRTSESDRRRTLSLFTKACLTGSGGARLEWMAHWNRLSSAAEWADFAPLSHRNRVCQDAGFARLLASIPLSGQVTLTAFAVHSEGAPGADERIASTSPALRVRRDQGYRSLDLGCAALFTLRGGDALTVGAEWSRDDQKLMNVIQVDLATGTEQAIGLPQGRMGFRNRGIYLQYLGHVDPDLDFTVNVRQDWQSVYGATTSYRCGLVRRLSVSHYVKALQATSFKAPSPDQLYAQPLYYAEIKGNPGLDRERATTTELEAGWEPSSRFLLKANAYHNLIQGAIQLVPLGTLVPRNLGRQRSTGMEMEAMLTLGRQRIRANASLQRTREEEPSPFQPPKETPSTAYPQGMANLRWQMHTSAWGQVEVGLRYASPRRATRSNIQMAYMVPYTLPPALQADVSYLLDWDRWSLQVRGGNFLDRRDSDPGSRGFDVPVAGRSFRISLLRRF